MARIALVMVMLAAIANVAFATDVAPANGKLKIFVLAGQSNMLGHGLVKGTEGALGTMETYLKSNPAKYGHLVDQNGKHVVRDDAWVVNLSSREQKGWLTVGYGARGHCIGPEYAFGFVVADYYEDPVLIIKCAWGGKSLYNDFLSPSSAEYSRPEKDGDKGFYYAEIVRHVKEITSNLEKYFPGYSRKGYEIVGFGWHQGWNDRIKADAVDAYEQNMANFIKDMRKDLGLKDLPFVIANTGMGGWKIPEGDRSKARVEKLMNAQLALGDPKKHPEFAGTVGGVETRDFQKSEAESPTKQGFHWFGNWETLYCIGEAMGKRMIELVKPAP